MGGNNFAESISALLGDCRLVHSILAKKAFHSWAFAQMALGANATHFMSLPPPVPVQRHLGQYVYRKRIVTSYSIVSTCRGLVCHPYYSKVHTPGDEVSEILT